MNGSKRYLQNVSLKFVSGMTGFVLSTASAIIVARMLGPEGNGVVALLLLIPGTITWFASLGIGRANGYFVGAKKYSLQALMGNSLSSAMIISLIIGAVYWLVPPFWLQYLTGTGINKAMLTLAMLIVPFALLEGYLEGLLLGLERIAQLSFVTIARFSSLLILNVILVLVFRLGVWGVLLSAIAAPGVCVVFYSYFLWHDARVRLGLDIGALKAALIFGAQGHVGNILHFLNLRLDVFVVSFLAGARSVGLYAVSTSIAELLPFFAAAFSYVLFPRTASSDPETASRFTPGVARLSALITIAAAVGLFVVSRPLITFFYSQEYLPSLYPLWILLPGMVSLGYAGVIFSDLAGRGKPYYSTYSAFVSLLVTVGIDCLLIPRWNIIGAAIASSVAYTINAAIAIYFYQKVTGIGLGRLLRISSGDIKAGFDAGHEIALSLNRAFRARWPLEG